MMAGLNSIEKDFRRWLEITQLPYAPEGKMKLVAVAPGDSLVTRTLLITLRKPDRSLATATILSPRSYHAFDRAWESLYAQV